jgi:hypothetical protein
VTSSIRAFLTVLALTSGLFLSGCTVAMDFKAPKDEIMELCNRPLVANRRIGTTPVSCETLEESGMNQKIVPIAPLFAGSYSTTTGPDTQAYIKIPSLPPPTPVIPSPGLIVLIEAGTWDANLALMAHPTVSDFRASSFTKLITTLTVPLKAEALLPHFRTFLSNFVLAFLVHTFTAPNTTTGVPTPQRYGHVYFVKSDAELKKIFLKTLRKATLIHPKVDLFLVTNGVPSTLLLTKELNPTSPANLKGEELHDWAMLNANMTLQQRNKVRTIFGTQSFLGKGLPAPGLPGMFQWSFYKGLKDTFLQSKFYGSGKRNHYPLHRDFVMFEKYYELNNFMIARGIADFMMRNNQDSSLRNQIVFPAIQGLGCMYVLGERICKAQAQPPSPLATNTGMYNASMPVVGP